MLASSTHDLLADQYLDKLAFGWQRRNRAIDSHVLDFPALVELDQKLIACIRGLTLIPFSAMEIMHTRLQEPLATGEMVAISLYAITTQNEILHNNCIALAVSLPPMRAPYLAAFEWASESAVWWAIDQWSQQGGQANAAWLVDIVVLAACRTHSGIFSKAITTPWWQRLLGNNDGSPTILYALLQTAMVTHATELSALAPSLLDANIGKLRCLAAQVVLEQITRHPINQYTQVAVDRLAELATGAAGPEVAEQATFALAVCQHVALEPILAELSSRHRDLYLRSLAWRGQIRAVPILISHLDDPEFAPLAGASLSMLTGSLPAYDGWQAKSQPVRPAPHVDDSSAIPPPPPWAELPPPSRDAFAHWWATHQSRFGITGPLLAGHPANRVNLMQVLHLGKLAWRRVALARLPQQVAVPFKLSPSASAPHQQGWLSNPSFHA